MTPEQKQKLLEQLEALKIFPNTLLVRELRKEITQKLKRAEKKIPFIPPRRETANISRSGKLKKYHRYLRMVRNSFPNLNYKTIRKQFSLRKKGKDSSIPDAVWQNPSP